jgi:hypothetical protein
MRHQPPEPPPELFAQAAPISAASHLEHDVPLGLAPTDPHIAHQDVPRTRGQNLAILTRLRQGPATNVELAGLALKYTSRLSDLRANGHTIQADARVPGDGGVVTYRLVVDGEAQPC